MRLLLHPHTYSHTAIHGRTSPHTDRHGQTLLHRYFGRKLSCTVEHGHTRSHNSAAHGRTKFIFLYTVAHGHIKILSCQNGLPSIVSMMVNIHLQCNSPACDSNQPVDLTVSLCLKHISMQDNV